MSRSLRVWLAASSAGVATVLCAVPSLSVAPPLAAPPAISGEALQPHLEELARIATVNGGNRAAGRPGYTKSVEYVEGKLRAVGLSTQRQTCTSCANPSDNLWTEFKGADPNTEYVFGAHLDSVPKGPGVNDNASGSSTLLEVASRLQQAGFRPRATVRFIWFTSEETGLEGSAFYVKSLGAAKSKIKTYFNFDMTASPNGGYFMINADRENSKPLRAYLDANRIPVEEDKLGKNRQDDASFTRAGIVSSGLATGAEETGTKVWNQKWGIKVGKPLDACYHQQCDTIVNINPTILDTIAKATMQAAWIVGGGA